MADLLLLTFHTADDGRDHLVHVKKTDTIEKSLKILRKKKNFKWNNQEVALYYYPVGKVYLDLKRTWQSYELQPTDKIEVETIHKGYESD